MPYMEDTITTYRRLSGEIETLFDLGNDQEGARLLAAAIQESREDQAYNLFFRSEVAGIDGDYRKQGRLLTEANSLRPGDYFLARNMGVCLLLQERHKEAVDWLEHYRPCWEERLDRLSEYLRNVQRKKKKHGRKK